MIRFIPRALMAPAVITLFLWMIGPLVITIYFSVIRYNLMQPDQTGFIGLENFEYFVTDPSFGTAVLNTLLLLGSVILITVVLGSLIALLIDDPFPGRGLVRILLISPFFVMPTVNALLWKHMMMNPIYGVLAQVWLFFGGTPVDWLTDFPLLSVIIIVSWQWLPFATLIFITSLQSMNPVGATIASLGLIAAGSAMVGLAGRGARASFGTTNTGINRGAATSSTFTERGSIGLPSSIFGGATPASGISGNVAASGNMVTVNATIIGPNDPRAQRDIAELVKRSAARGAV